MLCVYYLFIVLAAGCCADIRRCLPQRKIDLDDEDDGFVDEAYVSAALAAPITASPSKASAIHPEPAMSGPSTERSGVSNNADAPKLADSTGAVEVTSAWLSDKQHGQEDVMIFSAD